MWFDPKARKGQDVIFNAECLQLTDKYFYIHKALYHYRYLQESVTNRFNERLHHEKVQRLKLRGLCRLGDAALDI